MSAIARYFNRMGKEVHGYDLVRSDLTRELESEGMLIHYEDNASLIPDDVDLIVRTPAVPSSLGEYRALEKMDVEMVKRAEVLGMISKSKRAIGVAGTHGKTTTSTMLSYLLKSSGLDIAAFLGGIAKNYDSNYIEGLNDVVVMEADEFDRSFWHIHPEAIILTSMDPDHLDIYGDHDEMIRSYKVFVRQLRDQGLLIYHHSLVDVLGEDLFGELKGRGVRSISYGVESGEASTQVVKVENGFLHFDYADGQKQLDGLKMKIPGRHNLANMTAAIAMALEYGVNAESIIEQLPQFEGIVRRFEIDAFENGVFLVSDYAHHPEELNSAIQAAREFFPGKKLTGVFQPHLYSRTKDFADEFAAALDKLDRPILVELYPAREEPIEGIHSTYILNKMKNPNKVETTKQELINDIREQDLEILMILGAGDLDRLIPTIKETINKK